MKTIKTVHAALVCGIILLQSCAVSKNSISIQNNEAGYVSEGPVSCFVKLNDGTIKQFNTLKLVTGVLTTPHLVGDGKVVINAREIVAYQNDKHYAVSSKWLTSTRSGNVSAETLPGFAVKVVSGKLNVYCRKYYNGANTADEYFIQNGNDGEIVSCTKEVVKNMLKSDAEALAFFNSKSKISSRSKKLLTAVEIYNRDGFISKQ